jgi:hypothetical protein
MQAGNFSGGDQGPTLRVIPIARNADHYIGGFALGLLCTDQIYR